MTHRSLRWGPSRPRGHPLRGVSPCLHPGPHTSTRQILTAVLDGWEVTLLPADSGGRITGIRSVWLTPGRGPWDPVGTLVKPRQPEFCFWGVAIRASRVDSMELQERGATLSSLRSAQRCGGEGPEGGQEGNFPFSGSEFLELQPSGSADKDTLCLG